jgi:hypothetical protein
MSNYQMAMIMYRRNQLVMTLMIEEQPQSSTSLLTRPGPMWWGKPILQLLIGLMPLPPLTGGQKRKRPPPALKRKQSKTPSNQVMTQFELPLYRRPRSPLDLVDVDIIFGCLFKPFDTHLRLLVLEHRPRVLPSLRRKHAGRP